MIEYKLYRLPKWMSFWFAGITLGKHVFMVDPTDTLLLNHELVHVKQQKEYFWKFWFWELLFPLPIIWSWRYKCEAEAYAVQVRAGYSIDAMASIISGWKYLWPCRKKTAIAEIQKYL